jgi:SAM-dependent methyltransferase
MAISTMSNKPLDDLLTPLQEPPPAASSASHYKPISTIISPPANSNASPSKSLRLNSRNNGGSRPLSSAFSNMGFLKPSRKGKEKEERPVTPQRDSFLNRTLKPKKSLNSLVVLHEEHPLSSTPPAVYTPSLTSTFAESSTAGYSIPDSSPGPSSSTFTSTISPSNEEDKYETKENWITRKNRLKLHPYGAQAPYMQSYDPVALSVDRYTHMLLRRLIANGTPTFYDYAKHKKSTPTSILDLGCGEGHWIIDASKSWPDAQIVGFDLVDILLPEVRKINRLSFIRGNFVRFPLPFPPNTFDLVRMANLSLAIPADSWEFVLTEVNRVLQVSGRLELIDDVIAFPYGKEYSTSDSGASFDRPDQPNQKSSFDLFDEDDYGELAPLDEDALADEKDGMQDDSKRKEEESSWAGTGQVTGDEAVEEPSEEEPNSGVTDDAYSECPSSPETTGDGLFLDIEDSRSSASSLQEMQDPEDPEESKLLSLSPSIPPPRSRPLPPTHRPLPPIPASSGNTEPSCVTATNRPDEDEDDIVTPTKLDITLPTPALILDSETASSRSSKEEQRSDPVSTSETLSEESEADWSTRVKDGKTLEAIFFNMLEARYGVLTRTPKAIAALMKDTFGSGNVRKLRSMHLKLAPSELEELIPHEKRPIFRVRALSKTTELSNQSEDGEGPRAARRLGMDGKKEKKSKKDKESIPFPSISEHGRSNTVDSGVDNRSSSESAVVPNTLSAKAAVRLGITYSALAAATKSAQATPTTSSPVASVHSNHSSGSAASLRRTSHESRRTSSETQTSLDVLEESVPAQQSPGLLLLPSTFIPMHPAELEMHACKHMHTLLSCKRALSDWLLYNDDGTESGIVSEDHVQDIFFEYDFFRRRRLNWPSQIPETNVNEYNYRKNIEIPFEGPKSASSQKSTFSINSTSSEASIGPFNRHDLTHVRTIRVYFALKTRNLK